MNKSAFIICLLAVVISPLLFGSSYPFTYTPVFMLILAAGLLTLKASISKNAASGLRQFRWQENPLAPLFLIYVVFLIVTMIPLPAFLLEKISLVSLVVGGKSLPAAAMPDVTVRDFCFATASYIYPVRMSLVRWIVYGVFLWSFMAALDSRKRIESAIIVILILGCFESLYGIMQAYSGHEYIWWYKKLPEAFGFPAGTYLNRNHFAGLMEMGVILSLAYGMVLYNRSGKKAPGKKARLISIKAKLTHYFSEDQLYTKIALVVFSGVIMALGLFLSGSRGGILSLSIALVAMGVFFTSMKKYRRPGLYILIPFLILTVFYTITAGIDPTVERFKLFESGFLNREIRMEKTLVMFNDYELFGVGIGNFSYLFPRYNDVLHQTAFINYAHNDWAQLLAEGGMVGFVILLAAMGYYLFKTIRKWKQAQDAFAVCLGIAPVIALVSIGLHSLSDFNLHIPANMIMLIAMIAIGYRALYAEYDKSNQGFVLMPVRSRAILILAAGVLMIAWSGMWVVRHFVAEVYCNTVQTLPLRLDQHPPAPLILAAINWDDGNAKYQYKLAQELMSVRDKAIESATADGKESDRIILALEKAIRLNPFTAEYHIRLGWEYSYLWARKDYAAKWLPAADLSMERAAYFNGEGVENFQNHVDMGKYWTMRSKTLAHDPARQDVSWTKARWHFKKALALSGGKKTAAEIAAHVKNFYPDGNYDQEAVE